MSVSGSDDKKPSAGIGDDGSIGDVVDFVKTYAQQQTIEPIKGAGQWLAYGAVAAFTLSIGLIISLLGVLRLVQTEWSRSSSGSLSWLAYLITLGLAVLLLVFTLSRIKKATLNKEPK
jgi:hypothetical protein